MPYLLFSVVNPLCFSLPLLNLSMIRKSNSKIMADLKTPAKKELVGILLSAEVVETKAGDIIIVSIQDTNDEIITVSTSPNYWKKVGKLFPVESCVKASYEVRIKGTTGYAKDSAKPTELTAHESDGSNLVGITRFSSIAYQRMLDKKDIEEGVAIISSVEADRVGAVASYLSAFVRK